MRKSALNKEGAFVLTMAAPNFPSFIGLSHEDLTLRQTGARQKLREEQFHEYRFPGDRLAALLLGDFGVGGGLGIREGDDSLYLIILVTGIFPIGLPDQLRERIANFSSGFVIRFDQIIRLRTSLGCCRKPFRCPGGKKRKSRRLR